MTPEQRAASTREHFAGMNERVWMRHWRHNATDFVVGCLVCEGCIPMDSDPFCPPSTQGTERR